MFEGRGTCQFLGVPFSKKCRNYWYQFLKYVQNYGYHFLKNITKLLEGRLNINKINVEIEMKV